MSPLDRDLEQIRCGAADRDKVGRLHVQRPRHRRLGGRTHRGQGTGIGWIGRREPRGQAAGTELKTRGASDPARGDGTELRDAPADVDDERLGADLMATRHADERQIRLLLVRQHVERDARRVLDLLDDPGGIGRATDGLRPEERDAGGVERACPIRVAPQLVGQRRARGRTEMRLGIDGGAEPEEDGFISERPNLMAVDRRYQKVDGVRPEVDRRADGRWVGHAPPSGSRDATDGSSSAGGTVSDEGADAAASAGSDVADDISAAAGAPGATPAGSGGGGALTGRSPGSGTGAGDGVDTPAVTGASDGRGDEAGGLSVVPDEDGVLLALTDAVDLAGAGAGLAAVADLAWGAAFDALTAFTGAAAFRAVAVAADWVAADSLAADSVAASTREPALDPASSRILPMIDATSVAAAAASRSRFSNFSLAASSWRIRLSAVARALSSSLVSFSMRFRAFFGADAVAALAAATTSSAADSTSGVPGRPCSCPFERLRSVCLSAIASSWVRISGVRNGREPYHRNIRPTIAPSVPRTMCEHDVNEVSTSRYRRHRPGDRVPAGPRRPSRRRRRRRPSRRTRPDDHVRVHRGLAADLDGTDALAIEPMLDALPRRRTDLDTARDALRLEPAGDVHGLAPDIEGELPVADHASDDRSGVDTDPELETGDPIALMFRSLDHRQSEIDDPFGVVGHRLRDASSRHVRVTDGLDLLQAPLCDELVEAREQTTEEIDYFVGRQARSQWRERDDVGEQHRHGRVCIGDRPL